MKFTKLKDFFSKIKTRFWNAKGYVMILVVVALPILLLGVRYAVQLKQKSTEGIYKAPIVGIIKKCAPEAALEVAKHWNPALTLNQQFGALIRKVDDIYNASPSHFQGVRGEAIGADTAEFNSSPSTKQIVRQSVSVARYNYKSYSFEINEGLHLFDAFCGVYDAVTSSECVLFNYEREEGAFSVTPHGLNTLLNISSSGVALYNMEEARHFSSAGLGGGAVAVPESNTDCVDIAIEGDNIKVRTDNDIAYAVPAKCNVDIVLSIPVNMAANNPNNRDTSTPIPEKAYYSVTNSLDATGKTTPIYQIREAYKGFLKNFMFTRGVNVGLIPYCGNVSIPISRVNNWTIPLPAFQTDYFPLSPYIRGAFLYTTHGKEDDGLTSVNPTTISTHYGRNFYSLTAIRCRAGEMTTESAYGNNVLMKGDILSNTQPNTDALKFVRQWFKPCYLGNANLLDMKCKKALEDDGFEFNPFHIAELTPDLNRIYNLLNIIVPYHCDARNVSNFVFLPIAWANNLFQNWTAGTGDVEAVDTTSNASTGGQLSRPSKTASGRKKAVILIVNKPDFFADGELTYLGFNNDMSEIPMIESDTIDFSTNYGDTNLTYPDGTPFDGTIQGFSKILKYTTQSGTVAYNSTSGYYESTGAATGRLTFPRKGLVKLVVEPILDDWKSGTGLYSSTYYMGVCYGNGKFVTVGYYGVCAYSSDGIRWTAGTGLAPSTSCMEVCYGNNKFVAVGQRRVSYSDDGMTWSAGSEVSGNYEGVCYGNDKFVAVGRGGACAYSTDGITWTESTLPSSGDWFGVTYGNGKFVVVAYSGNQQAAYSTDGITWIKSTLPSSGNWYCVTYGNGKFVTTRHNSDKAAYSSDGITWTESTLSSSEAWYRITYGNGKFVVVPYAGYQAAYSSDGITWAESTLPWGPWKSVTYGNGKFVAVCTGKCAYTAAESKITVNNSEKGITERTEFYIEPVDQQSDGDNYYVDLKNMENIRLVSAEITNRDYEKITPVCSMSGNTGTVVITTNTLTPVCVDVFVGDGSVEFFNENGVVSNLGSHTISGSQTFTFSGPICSTAPNGTNGTVSLSTNFGQNFSMYKLRYSLNNCVITSASLTNQVLRDCHSAPANTGTYKDGTVSYGDAEGGLPEEERTPFNGTYWDAGDWSDSVARYKDKTRDAAVTVTSGRHCGYSIGHYWILHQTPLILEASGITNGRIYTAIPYADKDVWHIDNDDDDTYETTLTDTAIPAGNIVCNFSSSLPNKTKFFLEDHCGSIWNSPYNYIQNNGSKGLITGKTGAALENAVNENEGIGLISLGSSLSTNIPAGNYVCFMGDGELNLTVKPSAEAGTVGYTDTVGNSQTLPITASKTIVISPESFQYVKQEDGNYEITLSVSGPLLSNARNIGKACFIRDGNTTGSIEVVIPSKEYHPTLGITATPQHISNTITPIISADRKAVTFIGVKNTTYTITAETTDISWTTAPLPGSWYSVCYGGGKFVAVGFWYNDDILEYKSEYTVGTLNENGHTITWTSPGIIDNDGWWYGVCYGNEKFFAAAWNWKCTVGTLNNNTITWSTPSGGETDYGSGRWINVCYTGNKFVTLGLDKYAVGTLTGDDIVNELSGRWYGVCYDDDNEKFVAVDEGGTYAVGTLNGNDVTWVLDTLPGQWYGICCVEGKFIAVGSDKYAIGILGNNPMWTSGTLSGSWRDVCYGGDKIVAVSSDGKYAVGILNDNTVTWTTPSGILSGGWRRVCYGDGKFVAVAGTKDASENGKYAIGTPAIEQNVAAPGKAVNDYICNYTATFTNAIAKGTIPTVTPASYEYDNYSNCKYTYTDASGAIQTEQLNTQLTSIAISPNSHKYVPNSDGTYSVSISLGSGCRVTATPTDSGTDYSAPTFQMKELRLPEMSNVLDFTNPSIAQIFSNPNMSISGDMPMAYFDGVGHWLTPIPMGGGWEDRPYDANIYSNIVGGDFFFMVENILYAVPARFSIYSTTGSESYSIAGLHRQFQSFSDIPIQNVNDTQRAGVRLEILNLSSGGRLKYYHAGFTLPINAPLYYGGYYNAENNFGSPPASNTVGITDYDPHRALQRVTAQACAKLKSDIGTGRIYVIKYRKQNEYKNSATGATVPFDYRYINNCATNSSYVYDVSTEEDLNSTLETIAENIKEFGGYEPAKNTAGP